MSAMKPITMLQIRGHALLPTALVFAVFLLVGCGNEQERVFIPYCAPDAQFKPGRNVLVWDSSGSAYVLQQEYASSRVRYIGRLPSADRAAKGTEGRP